MISIDLLPRKHILEITKKANQRVSLIRRCFTNITQRKLSTLFKTTVRSLLLYASVVWQPHLKNDIDMLQWGGQVVRWCWVNFQCRGVLLIWIIVGQGPTALAVGAGGGCLDFFSLIYQFPFLSPALWETARYRLKYCLKVP